MKKAVVGCLLVMVVLLALGVAGVWFGIVRPGKVLIERVQVVASYETKLDNQRGFEAPTDGRLTQELVERYVQVRRSVASAAASPIEEIAPALRSNPDINDVGEFIAWLRTAKKAVGAAYDIRLAQIDAMNEVDMSRAEFEWVGAKFFTVVAPGIDASRLREMLEQGSNIDWDAVGLPGAPGSAEPPAVATPDGAAPADAAAGDGKPPGAGSAGGAPVPPSGATAGAASIDALAFNATLVEPYREEAQDWVQFFAIGF